MKKFTVVVALASILSACHYDNICIRGNGHQHEISFEEQDFEAVHLDGAFDVSIRQGRSFSITAVGDENILNYLEVDARQGVLDLDLESGCYKDYDLVVYVTLPYLTEVTLSGSGDIEVDDFNNSDVMDVHLTGSGNIYLHDLSGLNEIWAGIDGSGNIIFNHSVREIALAEWLIGGSGNIDAFALHSNKVYATIEGSGNIRTTVTDNLDARISGSGDIRYRGYPMVRKNITGSGRVIDEN